MDRIPLFTASSLDGLVRLVETELGNRALRRAFADAGLSPKTPLREGYFVPETSVVKFLGTVAHQTGDALLGARLGVRRDIGTHPAVWGQYVMAGATLQTSLERLERVQVCMCTHPIFRVDITKEQAWIRFQFATSGVEDYEHAALANAGSLTNIVRHYTGPDWFPEIIELDIPRPPSPSAVEEILPADIRYNAGCIGLAFPREFLTLRRRAELPHDNTTFSDALRARNGPPPETFEAAVAEIVRLQILSGAVSLDAAARSLDLGVRTVQRELDRQGLHYRRLTQRVRMARARELVAETQLPLSSVARNVGYANQFNFSRAFKREVGISPSQFRAASKLQ